MSYYRFQEIKPNEEDWERIESAYDSTCFQTRKWMAYLDRIHYKPFVAEVFSDDENIGYFLGEKLWRAATLVTAPYEGIGTYTQGLSLTKMVSKEDRVEIYKSLAQWLFDTGISSYFQVDDWQLREDSQEWVSDKTWYNEVLDKAGVRYEIRPTLHVDLRKTEEELWAGLHYKSCKYSIHKAEKLGLQVRTVDRFEDIAEFVRIHYDQLRDVCAKQGMKPKASQKKDRMLALCESLFPDRVIMIQVVGKDEECRQQVMSSGIFCLDKGECSYWTGASYQRYQKYCPNELMVWEAMRMMHEKGGGDLNFCGMADYKLKFGTIYAFVPRLVFTKRQWIRQAKGLAKKTYYWLRKI